MVKDRPWNDGLDLAWVERLPLVRPVRLIASDRYDPHFRERDATFVASDPPSTTRVAGAPILVLCTGER